MENSIHIQRGKKVIDTQFLFSFSYLPKILTGTFHSDSDGSGGVFKS